LTMTTATEAGAGSPERGFTRVFSASRVPHLRECA
jgi:hypothetical protein